MNSGRVDDEGPRYGNGRALVTVKAPADFWKWATTTLGALIVGAVLSAGVGIYGEGVIEARLLTLEDKQTEVSRAADTQGHARDVSIAVIIERLGAIDARIEDLAADVARLLEERE